MSYIASSDPERIDRDWVWRMLSGEAYWHRWRTRTDVEAQLDRAWRVVGIYDLDSDTQVGFARAISDGISDAYLADVIVDPRHRGRGLGKLLLAEMIEAGAGAAFRWTLFTDDAHGLYRQFGFVPPDATAMVRPSARSAGE